LLRCASMTRTKNQGQGSKNVFSRGKEKGIAARGRLSNQKMVPVMCLGEEGESLWDSEGEGGVKVAKGEVFRGHLTPVTVRPGPKIDS